MHTNAKSNCSETFLLSYCSKSFCFISLLLFVCSCNFFSFPIMAIRFSLLVALPFKIEKGTIYCCYIGRKITIIGSNTEKKPGANLQNQYKNMEQRGLEQQFLLPQIWKSYNLMGSNRAIVKYCY